MPEIPDLEAIRAFLNDRIVGVEIAQAEVLIPHVVRTGGADFSATLTNNRRVLVSANGPVYGLRLSDYHRLDARITRRFETKHGEVRVFLDLFNAYDRTNVVGYDHNVVINGTTVTDTKKPRKQLPLLPSLGAEWAF